MLCAADAVTLCGCRQESHNMGGGLGPTYLRRHHAVRVVLVLLCIHVLWAAAHGDHGEPSRTAAEDDVVAALLCNAGLSSASFKQHAFGVRPVFAHPTSKACGDVAARFGADTHCEGADNCFRINSIARSRRESLAFPFLPSLEDIPSFKLLLPSRLQVLPLAEAAGVFHNDSNHSGSDGSYGAKIESLIQLRKAFAAGRGLKVVGPEREHRRLRASLHGVEQVLGCSATSSLFALPPAHAATQAVAVAAEQTSWKVPVDVGSAGTWLLVQEGAPRVMLCRSGMATPRLSGSVSGVSGGDTGKVHTGLTTASCETLELSPVATLYMPPSTTLHLLPGKAPAALLAVKLTTPGSWGGVLAGMAWAAAQYDTQPPHHQAWSPNALAEFAAGADALIAQGLERRARECGTNSSAFHIVRSGKDAARAPLLSQAVIAAADSGVHDGDSASLCGVAVPVAVPPPVAVLQATSAAWAMQPGTPHDPIPAAVHNAIAGWLAVVLQAASESQRYTDAERTAVGEGCVLLDPASASAGRTELQAVCAAAVQAATAVSDAMPHAQHGGAASPLSVAVRGLLWASRSGVHGHGIGLFTSLGARMAGKELHMASRVRLVPEVLVGWLRCGAGSTTPEACVLLHGELSLVASPDTAAEILQQPWRALLKQLNTNGDANVLVTRMGSWSSVDRALRIVWRHRDLELADLTSAFGSPAKVVEWAGHAIDVGLLQWVIGVDT